MTPITTQAKKNAEELILDFDPRNEKMCKVRLAAHNSLSSIPHARALVRSDGANIAMTVRPETVSSQVASYTLHPTDRQVDFLASNAVVASSKSEVELHFPNEKTLLACLTKAFGNPTKTEQTILSEVAHQFADQTRVPNLTRLQFGKVFDKTTQALGSCASNASKEASSQILTVEQIDAEADKDSVRFPEASKLKGCLAKDSDHTTSYFLEKGLYQEVARHFGDAKLLPIQIPENVNRVLSEFKQKMALTEHAFNSMRLNLIRILEQCAIQQQPSKEPPKRSRIDHFLTLPF